jgi:hypothetical protein
LLISEPVPENPEDPIQFDLATTKGPAKKQTRLPTNYRKVAMSNEFIRNDKPLVSTELTLDYQSIKEETWFQFCQYQSPSQVCPKKRAQKKGNGKSG